MPTIGTSAPCGVVRRTASEHQKEFQRKLEDAGGRYVLAYSLDDVKAQVETALKLD